MMMALLAQMIDYLGSLADFPLAFLLFAIQNPQRILFQSSATIGTKGTLPGFEIIHQQFFIIRAALIVADAVYLNYQILQLELLENIVKNLNDFRIDNRIAVSDDLQIELMKLAIASGLRMFVPEYRAD